MKLISYRQMQIIDKILFIEDLIIFQEVKMKNRRLRSNKEKTENYARNMENHIIDRLHIIQYLILLCLGIINRILQVSLVLTRCFSPNRIAYNNYFSIHSLLASFEH